MKAIFTAVLFSCSLLGAAPSFACNYDTDCMPGSKCVKSGSVKGVCTGGMFPDTTSDRRAVYNPTDPNDKVGNKCAYHTDCGPLSTCDKPNGSIYGNCTK